MRTRKSPLSVSDSDALKELERIKKYRETEYPKKKIHGTINPGIADRKLSCIKRAIEIVKAHIPRQQKLFG